MKVIIAIVLNLMLLLGLANDRKADSSKITVSDINKIENLKHSLDETNVYNIKTEVNKLNSPQDWQEDYPEPVLE